MRGGSSQQLGVVLPFTRPLGEEVELAWATHRAFLHAELHDPTLCEDDAHNKARDRARRTFERLYADWSRQ